jgi:hypothetical protein
MTRYHLGKPSKKNKQGRAAQRHVEPVFLPPPFFCAKVQHPKTDKAKKLSEHRLAHRPKKGEFFFARFSAPHFGYPEAQRRGAQAGSPFLLGTFLLGVAKEKCLARRAETRLATGDYKPKNTTKLIAN